MPSKKSPVAPLNTPVAPALARPVSGAHALVNGVDYTLDGREIIYDWNSVTKRAPITSKPIEFLDETLRDGIQSPSVTDPPIAAKLEILHLMDSLGIHVLDMGLPGAGARATEDCLRLTQEIVRHKLSIKPSCAARTHAGDITPVIEISQKAGLPVEVLTFIGSSPIRQYAEEWDLDTMLRRTEEAVTLAVKNNLPVMFVTEDTTRAHPATLDKLFRTAINCGANRLCLCDTVGHATPDGLKNLLSFTQDLIRATGEDVKIDWHGHNDRGLSVVLTLYAIEFGADRVHGTGLGIGERVGNTPLDQVLLNLKLLGELDHDMTNLVRYCEKVSEACGVPIPYNYPLAGRDAFRTATGVHASAIIKAEKKGHTWLADRIYSGVPAGLFGKQQEIEIGHYSGLSNVQYWLRQHGVADLPGVAEAVLAKAKAGNRLLSEAEIFETVAQFGGPTDASSGAKPPASKKAVTQRAQPNARA